MKIRDLREYVALLTGGQNDFELGGSEDILLRKLYGEGTTLNLIKQLTSFAKNIHEQVFYEFLQNARDAGGDSFYVFYDQQNLLIINNGEPFRTNSKLTDKAEPGQLHAFLRKNQSDKAEEQGYIGKHGQGSKLMYDFLSDFDTGKTDDTTKRSEVLFKAMTEDLKAPVLFSWSQWHQLEGLRTIDFNNLQVAPCTLTDAALLTKLVYAYFPVIPRETRKVTGGKQASLFTQEEFNRFNAYVQSIFNEFTAVKNSLGKGTMIYIPLGKGHAHELDKAFNGSLRAGLATSMAFLEKIKEVRINGYRIQQVKYNIEPLTMPIGDKNLKFRLAYPTSVTDFQSRISNFYQYFPITNEQHGFRFILDSNDVEIDSARQNLDLSKPNNRNLVAKMADQLISYAKRLKSTNWNEYLLFYRCLLHTERAQESRKNEVIQEKLFNPILIWLKENVPTADRKVADRDGVVMMQPLSFDIPLPQIGIDKYWIAPELLDDAGQLDDLLEIQSSELYEILNEADEDSLAEWVNNLPEKDYRLLWQRIAAEKPNYSDIGQLFCIRAADGTTKSFDDWEEDTETVLLSKRTAELVPYLKRLGIPYAGEGIVESLAILDHAVDEQAELRKILSLLEDYRESIKPQDKRAIFRILTDKFADTYDSCFDEVEIFRSVRGDFRKLSDLMNGTEKIAPSGLLSHFQIEEAEYDPCLNDFLMQKEQVWEKLMDEWDTEIRQELSQILPSAPQKLKGITKDIFDVHKMSDEGESLPDNQPIIWTAANRFASIREIYFVPEFAKLTEDAYLKVSKWISSHADLMTVPPSICALLKQYAVGNSKLGHLADHLKHSRIAVSESDLEVLSNMRDSKSDSLLKSFVFLDNGNGMYELMKKGSDQWNYWSEDATVNDFFRQDFISGRKKYVPLPRGLYSFFNNHEKEVLKTTNEELVNTWIELYGAKREFINVIIPQSQDTIGNYIKRLQVLEISSSKSYPIQSFESKLLHACLNKPTLIEKVKAILSINAKPYSYYQFHDDLSLTVNDKSQSFKLSQILEEYAGTSDVIEEIKKRFEDSSVRSFFKMSQANLVEVMEKRLGKGISHIEHLLFCVAFACHKNNNQYTPQYIQQRTQPLSISDEVALDRFFERGLPFKGYYHFKDFDGRCLILPTQDTFLFVKEERTISWLEAWLKKGNKPSEKENFLLDNGFSRINDLKDFQLRKAAYNLTVDKELAEDWAQEQNSEYFSNTLRWLEQKFEKQEASRPFMEDFVHITTALAKQTGKLQPRYVLTINRLLQNEDYEVTFSKYDSAQKYCYTDSTYGRKNSKLADACRQRGYHLIYSPAYCYREEWFDMLKAYQIPLAYVEQKLGKFSGQKEWLAKYYAQWKKEYVKDKYTIFLCNGEIPFREELVIGETRSDIQGERLDKAGRIKQGANKWHLFLTAPGKEKSVLQVLEENSSELFDPKDDLLKLFSLSAIPDSQREILDEIQTLNITKEEAIKRLSASTTGIGTKVQPTPTEAAGYDLGGKWEQQEIEKIKQLKNVLQKFLKKGTVEKLQKMLEKAMRLEETEKEAQPNSLSGYFGEQLYYQWLNKHYSDAKIQYVAQERWEMDFIINSSGREIEIDVKTHQKSNREQGSDAIPFYIHKNQWKHLANNHPENYVVARISLEDIGLLGEFKQCIKGAKSDDEQVKRKLKALAASFMQDPQNQDKFQNALVQLRLHFANILKD